MTSVCIHPNSGPDVGLGHLVRCLALATALDEQGATVTILLEPDGIGAERTREASFVPVIRDETTPRREAILDVGADVVVVDSYDVWAETLTSLDEATTIAVVDELGDREFTADLVINNNVYADAIPYPGARRTLRGPAYCMLREAFRNVTPEATDSSSVLVTLGGSDLAGSFEETVAAIAHVVPEEVTVDAVVGPYFDAVSLDYPNLDTHRNPQNLPELMTAAAFAVTGGGQTMYELAACATPAIAVEVGPDQHRNIEGLAEAGFCMPVGRPSDQGFVETLVDAVDALLTDASRRATMAQNGRELVDGRGADRVASAILDLATENATTSSSA